MSVVPADRPGPDQPGRTGIGRNNVATESFLRRPGKPAQTTNAAPQPATAKVAVASAVALSAAATTQFG